MNRISAAYKAVRNHPAVSDNIFISKQFEARFIIKFCAFAFLGSLLFTSLILYYSSGSLTTSFDGSRLAIKQTSLAVFPGVLYTNLIMLFLAAIISITLTLYLLHSIRKPLFRFRKDIKAIAAGNLAQKIQYRNPDLTTPLAQNINAMTLNFNSIIGDVETGFKQSIEAALNDKDVPDALVMEMKQLQRGIQENFIR